MIFYVSWILKTYILKCSLFFAQILIAIGLYLKMTIKTFQMCCQFLKNIIGLSYYSLLEISVLNKIKMWLLFCNLK